MNPGVDQAALRVTKLGEILPIGRLFTFGQFFENYIPKKPELMGYFFQGINYVLILTQNGLCFIFGIFFHKLIWQPWLRFKFRRKEVKFAFAHRGCQIILGLTYQNGEKYTK
jgi:hypothetical protein